MKTSSVVVELPEGSFRSPNKRFDVLDSQEEAEEFVAAVRAVSERSSRLRTRSAKAKLMRLALHER